MRKLKVKEILDMTSEELEKMMTEKQFDRMLNMKFEDTHQLLDMLKDGAKESGLYDNDDYITIDEYLDYIEDIKITNVLED